MKEKFLSNIIDYVIQNEITDADIVKEYLTSFVNGGEEFFNLTKEDMSSPKMIWGELKPLLNLSGVSLLLVEKFKETVIDSEDFTSASYMRKEIYENWDFNEEIAWNKGRSILFSIKESIKNLPIDGIGELITDGIYVENLWINKRLESTPGVIKFLEDLKDFIVRCDENVLVDFQVYNIDVYIEFFKIVNPRV